MTASTIVQAFEPNSACAPVTLGIPSVEYVGSVPRGAPASWAPSGAARWSCADEMLRFGLTLGALALDEHTASRPITLTAVAEHPAAIRRCRVTLRMRCAGRPHHLDAYCRWREVHDRAVTTEATPFVLRWRDPSGPVFELRSARGCIPAVVGWNRGVLTIDVQLDAAALHPRWSFATGRAESAAAPARPAGWSSRVELVMRRLDRPAPTPAVLGRLPFGAEAAVTITDHPDFDEEERFRVFAHGANGSRGWVGRGLRLTKSVFAVESDSVPRKPAPTLERPAYRALLDELHGEGSEIAPHGVNESGNIGPDRFRRGLAALAQRYRPDTWIDHGLSLLYCYTMGGADNPDYDLLSRLRDNGITTLWSYHDAPVNAAASLNLVAPDAKDLGDAVRGSMRHAANRNYLIATHYLRTAFLSRSTGALHHTVGKALSVGRRAYLLRGGSLASRHAAAWSAAGVALLGLFESSGQSREGGASAERLFTRTEGLEWGATVYPERAVPMHQVRADDQLLFATQEVLHLRDAYTPAAFERLVHERGLHLAHTYLLNTLPYVAGMFSPNHADPRFTPAWERALDSLTAEVAAGRVWNPPVGELARWFRTMQCLAVTPRSECAIELSNPTGEVMHGATVMLPASVRPEAVTWNGRPATGSRRWSDWLCVWGDVPADSTVVVRWDRIRVEATPPRGKPRVAVAGNDAGTAHEPAVPNVVIFWDYDTQWGADRSRNPNGAPTWGALEFPNTDALLELHARYGVPACFAVVGAAALPGSRPYHDPDQIRRIHEAGHEVASHSFRHEWLPGLDSAALDETVRHSKDALEQCIGAEVVSFVPPFNQPFDYPRRLSVSLSERRTVRHERTDVGRLCASLNEAGYRFCRLAYRPLSERVVEVVRGRLPRRPGLLEDIGGIACVRLNLPVGFTPDVRAIVERHLDRGGLWTLHGHPHSASDDSNPQSLRLLDQMLSLIRDWREQGRIRTVLPRDLVGQEATQWSS
ncbi:MAG TPA: polysaccharide deacetylase family protein [Gemmatimonadaceae bacterium]